MSRLLAALLAACATLALSGVALAEDLPTRTEAQSEHNQDDRTGQATVETGSPDRQAATDADDRDDLVATDADNTHTVVIIVPGDQDEQAATDADDANIVVIIVPQNQDPETSADAGGSAADQQAAQDRESQPAQNTSQSGGLGETQHAAIPQPDYSAELKKCDWVQGKRRTHCIDAIKKQFGEM